MNKETINIRKLKIYLRKLDRKNNKKENGSNKDQHISC